MEVLEDSSKTEAGSSLRNSKDYALNLSISAEFPNHFATEWTSAINFLNFLLLLFYGM